jgi:uncharacterized protein YndB with AHSA1/START domain
MKILLRATMATVLAFAVALGTVFAIGAALPRAHVAARSVLYRQPVEIVWATIADWEHSPEWRRDVRRVDRLPDHAGHPVWRQDTGRGTWALEILEEVPLSRMVAGIADSRHGFGGSWTYTLTPEAGGTRLTLVERGFVDPPMLRFLMRFVFGLHTSIDLYLTALGTHFGERVTPADAPRPAGHP